MAITVSSLTPANYQRGKRTAFTATGLLFTGLVNPVITLNCDTQGSDVTADTLVVVDATHITGFFDVPSEFQKDAAQTSDLTITDDITSGSLANCARITANPPTISDTVTPNHGTAAGGTGVIITGTGLDVGSDPGSNNVVEMPSGTTVAGFSVDGPTQITATTPAHAAGAVKVKVTTDDGSAETTVNAFTYDAVGPPHRLRVFCIS